MLQLESVVDKMNLILSEARKKLGFKDKNLRILDKHEFEQGVVHICPICLYQSKSHPRGSAIVRGHTFKCFSCGETRKVE